MPVWMIGIDRKWTSYNELKDRSAVAQGWPDLGDLSNYIGSKNIRDEIQSLCLQLYDNNL